MLKRVIQSTLGRFGYRVSRTGWDLDDLQQFGFAPATLIDVGVAYGTPALYQAFPKAHLVLVEPLAEYEPQLRTLVEGRGEYLLTAVGRETGSVVISIDLDYLPRSSLHKRSALTPATNVMERRVDVTTLDTLLAESDWSSPFGLKIDAEGSEHEVIQGASKLLTKTEFVIAEVSVAERYEDSYSFASFISLMDEHGFRLCEILHQAHGVKGFSPMHASRLSRELIHIDALFRR